MGQVGQPGQPDRRMWDKDSERERKRLYRERKAAERAAEETLAAAMAEDVEQAIRDDLGYTASETRTKAERDAAAERMLARVGGFFQAQAVEAWGRDVYLDFMKRNSWLLRHASPS